MAYRNWEIFIDRLWLHSPINVVLQFIQFFFFGARRIHDNHDNFINISSKTYHSFIQQSDEDGGEEEEEE